MFNHRNTVIFLLLLTLGVVSFFLVGIFNLNLLQFNLWSQLTLVVIGVALVGLALILLIGTMGIILTMRLNRPIKLLIIPTKIVISYIVPVVIQIASWFGMDKERVQNSFIQISNQLINPEEISVAAEDLLILMPHCIQLADCSYRVTSDINNCQRCGGCQVDDIIALKEKYGVHLAFATGGTLARKIIKETRPKAIVAVACERDLSSGIQDVYPLPVIGVVNLRPNGPCYNTKVELDKLEAAVKRLLEEQ
ncbi:DUF116 domain-containing protein [Halanaerobacter jeridensis]|uniref:DUF116 domain-containing protein n=1 Tax=Halanaerobacter jeridensis TaxID=706427 RepID=UPI00195E0C69|nr:DUF116 domain-containing protein [Halanaerobacter jeridensis]